MKALAGDLALGPLNPRGLPPEAGLQAGGDAGAPRRRSAGLGRRCRDPASLARRGLGAAETRALSAPSEQHPGPGPRSHLTAAVVSPLGAPPNPPAAPAPCLRGSVRSTADQAENRSARSDAGLTHRPAEPQREVYPRPERPCLSWTASAESTSPTPIPTPRRIQTSRAQEQ